MSEFGFMISTADVNSLISPLSCDGGVGRCLGGLWGHFGGTHRNRRTPPPVTFRCLDYQYEELILRTLLLVRLHGGDLHDLRQEIHLLE